MCSDTGRSLHYKEWCESSMTEAIKACTEKKMSIRKASESYNVPRSTLADRISGRVLPGAKSGPHRILSDEEE